MLTAIGPIDGRYASKTDNLQKYFSEFALIKYRVLVEIVYLKHLIENDIAGLSKLKSSISDLENIYKRFSLKDAERIKNIESVTNHDVKAVEYFIKECLDKLDLSNYKEWVHFALTSQDINNTATPLMIKDYLKADLFPAIENLVFKLNKMADSFKDVTMLARTHGQPASPTNLGKEIKVFTERLENQYKQLSELKLYAKFGGATGNFNAHIVSFPKIDWKRFADDMIQSLGLQRHHYTTQIAHYDDLAALFHNLSRINTILIDLCRDIWTYISMDYFGQKTKEGEIGSSAMPHKVNPIDFENAEGNLGMANAVFAFLAEKLPVSRLQRDLTDSTVLRNAGVPFAHMTIALNSLDKGLGKLTLNEDKIRADLDNNWAVVAEAIQNILRRESYPQAYETLKSLTRGKAGVTQDTIKEFVSALDVDNSIKEELLRITPHNYTGYTE